MRTSKRRNAETSQWGNALVAVAVFCGATLCAAPCPAAELVELPFVYETWETFTTRDGLPHDSVRAIRVQGDKVWVGTEGGLAVLERGACRAWTHLDPDNRVPLPAISAIDVDARTRDVWLGTWGGGLIRFSAGRFDLFDQKNSGLAGNLVFALAVADGWVWAANNGGINSFDPIRGTWDLYLERRYGTSETAAISLSLDPSGTVLYVGAWCGGVRTINVARGEVGAIAGSSGSRIADLAPHDAEPGDTMLAVDRAGGALWLATQERLFRLSALRADRHGGRPLTGNISVKGKQGRHARDSSHPWDARSIPDGFIYCLAARSETEAWLGTDRGLQVLADWSSNTWVAYHRVAARSQGVVTVRRGGQVLDTRRLASMFPDNRIRCVAFQGDDVWVGTAGGLVRGIGSGRWTGLSLTSRGSRSPEAKGSRAVAADRAASEESGSGLTAEPAMGPASSGVGPGPLKPVAIGVLSPVHKTVFLPGQRSEPSATLGRVDPSAVLLAVEDANARGGYRGRVPFIVPRDDYGYARWGWNMPEDDFIALACESNVRGIVAYLGPGSRFATATALRTEVPVVNAAPTPATTDEIVNPWISRCPGHDPGRQKELLDWIFDQLGRTRPAVVRTPGPPAQVHLDLWARHARDRKHPVVADIRYDPQAGDPRVMLEAIQRSRADVVLTWCDAPVSAAILRAMRDAGMTQLFVGSEHIVTDEFIRHLGCDPGDVIALWACSARADRNALDRFARSYEARFKRPPRPGAFRCYDAARHLLRAINLAGLERRAIARTLQDMSSACMARLQAGRWNF